MTREMNVDSVRCEVSVPVPPERAFATFVNRFASWWPKGYTWAGEVLETIAVEPRQGGRCFERGPHGFRYDWGRVLVWESPRRLVLAWQISPARAPEPNPAKASAIEVRFVPDGPEETRVELEHRDFAQHGENAAAYRAAMGSAQGWPYILERYRATAGTN